MLVDSHCHLDFEDFAEDRSAILERAQAAGVQEILIAAVVQKHWSRVQALAAENTGIWAAAGVHPNEPEAETPSMENLLAALSMEKVVAVGETGLDYFRSEGDLRWQQERFARHIAASKATGKPVIVHTREAAADTLGLLRSEDARASGGVIHCFTENWEFARAVLDMGFYVSLSGIVTFKKSLDLQAVARKLPADRLLVETDSPYLAPTPLRGKRNEPAYVRHVAQFLAELRAESFADLARQTTENFHHLFTRTVAA
ncbi:TatD family hydrolase [Acidithiobacillus sp. HP-6]|uniref:TatD family hydrolase n=1 Tax=unclassified Acidithiobacillus TaxID=2614800 RepID=UPI00187A6BA4|nr:MULTISPECIES: TatD family hydrolase [unclassified Acidithiobacillus]MBE7564096.1 TatD family hydrolase [Acidithiobacillus sp. HP-6]MBE7570798.1 TatD family hydrolase [Acidithiobacillus sp. HP-2]MDD5280637.1 TatD family hydrolase [Acidithiobacillus sp.]